MLQGTENFWGKDFALQIMSVGSFVDDKSCEDAIFQVEAITVRLNPAALNEYSLAQMSNCRDCYDSYDEWNAYQEKKKLQMDEWKQKVLSAIGLESDLKGITIQQVQTEVFAIVRIWKMNG